MLTHAPSAVLSSACSADRADSCGPSRIPASSGERPAARWRADHLWEGHGMYGTTAARRSRAMLSVLVSFSLGMPLPAAALLPGVGGLDGVSSVAFSPDGAHVYATGSLDDAVAILSRDSGTGRLTSVGAQFDGLGVDGLDGAASVVVSPDGSHVYAVGQGDDAVVVFSRNGGTGALTFIEAEFTAGGVGAVAVSPDGAHVYSVGRADDAVVAFSRDTVKFCGSRCDQAAHSSLLCC